MTKRRGRGEGSVYRRKDGCCIGEYEDANGKRRYISGKTKAEVRAKLRKLFHRIFQRLHMTHSTRLDSVKVRILRKIDPQYAVIERHGVGSLEYSGCQPLPVSLQTFHNVTPPGRDVGAILSSRRLVGTSASNVSNLVSRWPSLRSVARTIFSSRRPTSSDHRSPACMSLCPRTTDLHCRVILEGFGYMPAGIT